MARTLRGAKSKKEVKRFFVDWESSSWWKAQYFGNDRNIFLGYYSKRDSRLEKRRESKAILKAELKEFYKEVA